MNIETLKQLAKNPHYKLSAKQKAELDAVERKPMVTFGSLNTHSNDLPLHNTGEIKQKVIGGRHEQKQK